MKAIPVFLLSISFSFTSIMAATLPGWVGASTHTWTPRLGGGIWYQPKNHLEQIASILQTEYPGRVLIGLRGDRAEHGYRFDLDEWDENTEFYDDWPNFWCSQECVIQKLQPTGNVDFIWSMPTPDHYSPTPYSSGTGAGYRWQTPRYYAAYLQYLIEPASMEPAEYDLLPDKLNFFTDESCETENIDNDELVDGNWGNLRAARGHPDPYPLLAVILGIEPYGTAQEKMENSGVRYGTIAKDFRNAIRDRAGALQNIPLGLNVSLPGAISNFEKPWFKPMLDTIHPFVGDFSYMDMYHHYRFGLPSDELNRIFPTMIHNGSNNPDIKSFGWQEWDAFENTWRSDFSRYLWMYEDIREALSLYGENPNRWIIGSSEHGLSVDSAFVGNDMGAALHWALYLAEAMRYNAHFDMNWVFLDQGNSHAQIQHRHGKITRTPGHYVYKMAQKFTGYEHLDTSDYSSPTTASGTFINQGDIWNTSYLSPDVEVRAFRNPADRHYHLFVINKHETLPATITGWQGWLVAKWDRLSGPTFASRNRIGDDDILGPWIPETIKTAPVSHTYGQPITIPPISVNHIEFAAPLKFATTSASDGWVFHPFLNGGGSQQIYSTTSGINMADVQNPAPEIVYKRTQVESSTLTWTVDNLLPTATYKVRVHLSSVQVPSYANVSETLWVSNGGSPEWMPNITPYSVGVFNKASVKTFPSITPSASGQLWGGISPTTSGNLVAVSGVEVIKNP